MLESPEFATALSCLYGGIAIFLYQRPSFQEKKDAAIQAFASLVGASIASEHFAIVFIFLGSLSLGFWNFGPLYSKQCIVWAWVTFLTTVTEFSGKTHIIFKWCLAISLAILHIGKDVSNLAFNFIGWDEENWYCVALILIALEIIIVNAFIFVCSAPIAANSMHALNCAAVGLQAITPAKNRPAQPVHNVDEQANAAEEERDDDAAFDVANNAPFDAAFEFQRAAHMDLVQRHLNQRSQANHHAQARAEFMDVD